MHGNRVSRRRFLQASAAVVPYYAAASSATAASAVGSDHRFALGLIGAGRMGHNHLRFATDMCNLLAVCDVDVNHCQRAIDRYAKGKATGCNDYREVLDNPKIEVVYIATPDHWHAKILVEAMLAGKDVYCEKPLTLTIDEGKLIRRVQKQTGRVVQVGTMQRSYRDLFVKAVAMAQEGRVGTIRRIVTTVGGQGGSGPLPVVPVPEWLDWNQWLGPAPAADFRWEPGPVDPDGWSIGKTNAHQNFRWWFDYSGGKITDWGAHHVDIACWALRAAGQSDELLSIGGQAKLPVPFRDGNPTLGDQYNTPTSFSMTAQVKEGVELVINSHGDNGVLIEGTAGRIFVNRGKLVGKPVEDLAENPLPDDAIARAYRGLPLPFNRHRNHWANFFHCVRERCEPISDVTSHLRAIDICHAANIAIRLGRSLDWDASSERFVGDEQANAMLAREYRKGFEIEV
ncbi:MAG: Gfo/Idh/MocA family oxidoreductase [Planctomycetota bacterium]